MNQKAQKTKKALTAVMNAFVIFIMMSMVIMIFVNAALRYLFNGGIAATEELSRFAFVWVSVLGAILAYYGDKHVGVDLLVAKLHGLPKLIIHLISEGLVCIAIWALGYGGWRYFIKTAHLESAALPIPMGVITITALFMAACLLPKTILNIHGHLLEYKASKNKTDLWESGDKV